MPTVLKCVGITGYILFYSNNVGANCLICNFFLATVVFKNKPTEINQLGLQL